MLLQILVSSRKKYRSLHETIKLFMCFFMQTSCGNSRLSTPLLNRYIHVYVMSHVLIHETHRQVPFEAAFAADEVVFQVLFHPHLPNRSDPKIPSY